MGYVHDTSMAQFIPPTLFHIAPATLTYVAGQVTGTVVAHRAAANQTTLCTIPISLPGNSVALKGAYLKSIEVDYEVLVAEPTSITWTLNKVTRGADTAVAVVAAIAKSATLTAATCKTVDQHKQTITLTTPIWLDNLSYILLEMAILTDASGTTEDFISAVANFTERL